MHSTYAVLYLLGIAILAFLLGRLYPKAWINENCIAEVTHVLAAILGFGCVFVWDGIGGWIMSILFLLFNIPFIIMQRFNRPRLITADMMLKRRSNYNSEAAYGNKTTTEENIERSCAAEAAET